MELLLPAAQSTIFFFQIRSQFYFSKSFPQRPLLSSGVPSTALTTISKLQGQHAALVEVQLVLVGFVHVEDLHVAALHAHGQPLPGGAVPQGEDLQEQSSSLMSLPSKLMMKKGNREGGKIARTGGWNQQTPDRGQVDNKQLNPDEPSVKHLYMRLLEKWEHLNVMKLRSYSQY